LKLSAARLDVLVWALMYGGLLGVGLGIALQRNGQTYGWRVVVAAAVVVAIGIVLLWVRSRRREPQP
jgi:predicted MFS family arabinose efflux permease